MKPQDEEKFELQPQLTHILLLVAALILGRTITLAA